MKLAYRNHVDESGFPRVLQADQRELHLLLPEQGLEPVQQLVEERDHGAGSAGVRLRLGSAVHGSSSSLGGVSDDPRTADPNNAGHSACAVTLNPSLRPLLEKRR